MFARAISLVSFPILTYLLAPSAYGVAALAFSLVSILTVFAVSGQDTSLIRNYHNNEHFKTGEIVRFFRRFGILSGAFFGLTGAVVWVGYNDWSIDDTTVQISAILCLSIWGASVATFGQAVARLEGHYASLAIALVVSGIGGLVLSIGTAEFWQANEVALLMAGLAPWILVAFLPRTRHRNTGQIRGSGAARKLMHVGFPMTVTACGFWIIASLDRWFLSAFADLASVGLYSVAAMIATLGQIVTTALLSVWNPEVFRNVKGTQVTNTDSLRQVLTVLLWILMTTWFCIGMFGGVLIEVLAAPEFHLAADFIPWIALGYMIYGFNQLFGFGFMIHHKTAILPWFWVVGVALSLGLNFVLVPEFGIPGAIVAQMTAFLVITALTWAVGKRFTPFQPHWVLLFLAITVYLFTVSAVSSWGAELGMGLEIAMRSGVTALAVAFTGWITLRNLDAFSLTAFISARKR